jgi:sulfoacetaldehyde dehydrogenase
MAPHPRGKETCYFVVEYMRSILKKYGAPEDLVLCIEPEQLSVDASNELMKQVDFVVATGGTPMVRVAYSSGTPTIGVGTGNATTYIDTTANLDDAADKIMRSKTFDNGSSCSTENSVVANKDIYDAMITALEKAGAFIIREKDEAKAKLQKVVWPEWPEKIGVLNREIPAATVQKIAGLAGITIPEDRKFIVVEENGGVGKDYPLTGEKLSVITTLIKANDFDDALNKMEAIVDYQGKGHSAGIHTTNDDLINKMALRLKVSRILVNQPQSLGNSGNWFNGLSNTMSLGCSTWGHNSTGNNLTWHDIVNYTVVSKPVDPNPPKDEDLFPAEIRNATL